MWFILDTVFEDCIAFNGDVSKWEVSRVTSMANMFKGAAMFNGDVSKWEVSHVTSMANMFKGAAVFNGLLSSWQTGKVQIMRSMFEQANAFNRDVSKWNMENVLNMVDSTLYGCILVHSSAPFFFVYIFPDPFFFFSIFRIRGGCIRSHIRSQCSRLPMSSTAIFPSGNCLKLNLLISVSTVQSVCFFKSSRRGICTVTNSSIHVHS